MSQLKVLIVEGNTHEENLKFQKLSNQPQSFNFKDNIKKYYPLNIRERTFINHEFSLIINQIGNTWDDNS